MFYDSKRIKNYSFVTLPVQSAGTYSQFNFPDQPQLRGKKVDKINFYSAAQVPYSPDGGTGITTNTLINSWLVLYIGDREDIKIPLLSLINITSATAGTVVNNNGYIPLQDLSIVWEKSYIRCPNSVIVTANTAFMFGVFYK
jgi:hypothetical protein